MDTAESKRRHNYFELFYGFSFFEDDPHFTYEQARVGKFVPKEGVLHKVEIS